MSEIPCPGAHCPHPPGHHHIDYGTPDGAGCVVDADGRVIDPFDLARPATIPPPVPLAQRRNSNEN